MNIRVADNGQLSLQDSDNFRAFAIVCEGSSASLAQLEEIASADQDNHYWLDAEAVLELSGRKHDQQWVKNFRAMLTGVAAYGYFDENTNRVKAHLEIRDD